MIGGLSALILLVSWALTTALTFAIITRDEKRLPANRLERAMLPSSRTLAVVAFGPFALCVHFTKTRGLRGLFIGLVLATLVVLLSDVALGALFSLLGVEMPG